MRSLTRVNLACAIGASVFVAGLVSPPRSQADDIEVFFSTSVPSSAKPNILFILDTSQSMYTVESEAPNEPYDPAKEYPKQAGCEKDRYYWTTGNDSTPNCSASGWQALDASQFNCPAWRSSVISGGFLTKNSRVAQKNTSNAWVNMTQNPQQQWKVACQGDTTGSEQPSNWNQKSRGKDLYPSQSYTFYSGNWLNWNAQGSNKKYRIDLVREAVGEIIANTEGIKVGLMRYGYDGARDFKQNTATACEVLPDANEANRSSNGAPVVFPITDLDSTNPDGTFPSAPDTRTGESTVRSQLRYQLGLDAQNQARSWVVDLTLASQPQKIVQGGGSTCPIPMFTPGGRSPIGGAMMEAYLYYSGSQWSQKYGKQAAIGSTFGFPSVPQSRTAPGSETYRSPMVESCAKNFIVLLSDGTTEQDNDVDGPIQQLPGFEQAVGKSCDKDTYLANGNPPPSQCVDDIAEYMFDMDLRSNSVLAGKNNVVTYTVGFKLGTDSAANSARQLLQETATRGGGSFYEAGNAVELKDRLGDITREILNRNTSFSAPAVTVNAFNRTQNLNDLYMALFRPAFNYRWLGNVKKYQLDPLDGDILDADNAPAVDGGQFIETARSFWSATDDGNDITAGGAAGLLEYDQRVMKTHNSSGQTVALTAADTSITDASLGIQSGDYVKPGVSGSGALTKTNLLSWLAGQDIADVDGDSVTDESRYDMGDPLHAKPVTVIYGAGGSLSDDALFSITNDGVLHAFDPDSNNPRELWAFVPRSQFARLRDLYYNETKVQPEDRGYGLDGTIRVLRIDNNRNGIIEPTLWVDLDGDNQVDSDEYDRVYLFFGQRRGGGSYFAFDVTYKNSPKLLWEKSFATEGAGQSWSTPVTAKIRDGSTVRNVLVFGGGYDTDQDGLGYVEDNVGVGVYIVDALTGSLIWRAGPDAGADLQLTGMKHSIPGDVRVIDLTGDGFIDRMYAADLGGRVWRFDIFNGKDADGSTEGDRLVEGGMLASLGNAEDSPRAAANTIRFFFAPDPALITEPGPPFINVAIGSGHRELPASDTTAVNWLYSIRDYRVLTPLMTSQYKSSCGTTAPCHKIVTEADLEDLTDLYGSSATAAVPVSPGVIEGWKLRMEETGEKVLAEARTFQGSVFFTTYTPRFKGQTGDLCGQKFGVNKLYVVRALDAQPIYDYNGDLSLGDGDRSNELAAEGTISPEVVFIFPTPPRDPNNPNAPVPAVPPVCLVGLENCGFGISNPPVRTYWRQRGAN